MAYEIKEDDQQAQLSVNTDGDELEHFARYLGVGVYGVAAAESFREFPKKPQPDQYVPGAKSVITVCHAQGSINALCSAVDYRLVLHTSHF